MADYAIGSFKVINFPFDEFKKRPKLPKGIDLDVVREKKFKLAVSRNTGGWASSPYNVLKHKYWNLSRYNRNRDHLIDLSKGCSYERQSYNDIGGGRNGQQAGWKTSYRGHKAVIVANRKKLTKEIEDRLLQCQIEECFSYAMYRWGTPTSSFFPHLFEWCKNKYHTIMKRRVGIIILKPMMILHIDEKDASVHITTDCLEKDGKQNKFWMTVGNMHEPNLFDKLEKEIDSRPIHHIKL